MADGEQTLHEVVEGNAAGTKVTCSRLWKPRPDERGSSQVSKMPDFHFWFRLYATSYQLP